MTRALGEKDVALAVVFTLRKWRRQGGGPAFRKYPGAEREGRGCSGRVTYSIEDVERFIAEMRIETQNPMPEAR
jgi:hypothetical protein